MWPFDYVVTWQIQKNDICSSRIPMATKLGRIVTCGWRNPPSKSCDFLIMWSRDKCKNLYLHFCNTYGHQTWQSSRLQWGHPTFKVMWPFDYVVTWQIQKLIICTFTIPMAIKIGRVVTWGGRTQSSKARELLITWSHDKWKKLISTLTQFLWPPNLAEC